MKKGLVFIMALFVIVVGCSQNNKEPGSGTSSTSDVNSEMRQQEAPQTPSEAPSMPSVPVTRAVEPIAADVLEKYSGVVMNVMERGTGKEFQIEIPFNTAVTVDGTPLMIEVTQFFPDFTMSDKGFSTKSLELDNVAARVKITGVSPEFDGILFKLYPDIHPYDNPNYAVILTDVVKK